MSYENQVTCVFIYEMKYGIFYLYKWKKFVEQISFKTLHLGILLVLDNEGERQGKYRMKNWNLQDDLGYN